MQRTRGEVRRTGGEGRGGEGRAQGGAKGCAPGTSPLSGCVPRFVAFATICKCISFVVAEYVAGLVAVTHAVCWLRYAVPPMCAQAQATQAGQGIDHGVKVAKQAQQIFNMFYH